KPKPNTLTPKEIADGWILLFDGETTFGWDPEPLKDGNKAKLAAKDGALIISGSGAEMRFTTRFQHFEFTGEDRTTVKGVEMTVGVRPPEVGLAIGSKLAPSEKEEWRPLGVYKTPRGADLMTGFAGKGPSFGGDRARNANGALGLKLPEI